MTLEEFSKKWDGKKMPVEASNLMGAAVGILSGSGFTREEAKELAADVYDLGEYIETEEGRAEWESIATPEESKH